MAHFSSEISIPTSTRFHPKRSLAFSTEKCPFPGGQGPAPAFACLVVSMWVWLEIKRSEGQTAGVGPCFHPGQPILEFRFFEPQPSFFLAALFPGPRAVVKRPAHLSRWHPQLQTPKHVLIGPVKENCVGPLSLAYHFQRIPSKYPCWIAF